VIFSMNSIEPSDAQTASYRRILATPGLDDTDRPAATLPLPAKIFVSVSKPHPVPHTEHTDPYLLRGLLWCGFCQRELATALSSTGIGYYGCENIECPRPLTNAEDAEKLVWQRFAWRYQAFAALVTPAQRQLVLYQSLKRVTVLAGGSELVCEWRPLLARRYNRRSI
jgi:hypothetical protein